MVAETLAELDTPPLAKSPMDVIVGIQLVGAFRAESDSFEGPDVVQPAIDEIRDTFPLSSYQLLKTLTVRTIPSGGLTSVRGYLQRADPVDYNIAIIVDDELPTPKAIKFSFVKVKLRRQGGSGDQVAEISTNLTASDGKTLVVRKAGVRGIADGILLLLTARLN